MTTSGTYSFTVTRDDIISEAMTNIGKLGDGESPDAGATTKCARKLNMMVKQWMGKNDFAPGLKMWTRQRGDLFLSSAKGIYSLGPSGDNWAGGVTGSPGNNYARSTLTAKNNGGSAVLTVGVGNASVFTASDYVVVQLDSGDIFSNTVLSINASAGTVTLNAVLPSSASSTNFVWNYTTKAQRPLSVLTAILRDSNNSDTSIDYMTLETYEALPTKVMGSYLGDPTAVYYEAQLTNGVLYTDVGGAQDVTKILHIVYLRPVQDFNNPLDNPEYPQEWYMALCWGLSKQIAPMFNAVWTKEMEDNFNESLAMARESNSEITQYYFQPNSGSVYSP